MGWHTIFESLKIEGELLWVEPATLDLGDHRVVVVDALTATIDLEPAEEQVEALAVGRVGLVGIGVEGALARREVGDKDEVAIMLLERPLADSALVFRLHIGLFAHTEYLLCLTEREYGELLAERGDRSVESREDVGMLLPHCRDRIAHRALEHCHHVGVVFDEAHLEVHLCKL